MVTAEKFSAKEAAREIGTDARTLRKFIRSSNDFDSVGQGNRYEFTKQEIKSLKKAFIAWSNGAAPKKTKKTIDEEIIDLGGDENPEDGSTIMDHLDDDNSEPAEVEWTDDADLDLEMIEGPEDDELEEIELDD